MFENNFRFFFISSECQVDVHRPEGMNISYIFGFQLGKFIYDMRAKKCREITSDLIMRGGFLTPNLFNSMEKCKAVCEVRTGPIPGEGRQNGPTPSQGGQGETTPGQGGQGETTPGQVGQGGTTLNLGG